MIFSKPHGSKPYISIHNAKIIKRFLNLFNNPGRDLEIPFITPNFLYIQFHCVLNYFEKIHNTRKHQLKK